MNIKSYLNIICKDPTKKKGRCAYLINIVKRGIIDIDNLLLMISLLDLKYHFAKYKSYLKKNIFKIIFWFIIWMQVLSILQIKRKVFGKNWFTLLMKQFFASFWSIKPILLRDCKSDGELGIEEEYWWSLASQQGKMEEDAKSNEK